ncbi:MAG: choice-of-anchor D domain-containing protein [Candidatus Cloacimonetes bacterium]|nr:choice-of-anchor D domain-containing protein [Candidatus Cloacimonadota bacterium]
MKRLFFIFMIFLLIPLTLFAEREWTILATYPIPEGSSGLAWDGTYLYSGIYGSAGGDVYQIDPSNGSYHLQFTGSQGDAYGMTYDGTNLVIVDHGVGISDPAIALKYTTSGTYISQFNLPDHYMSGIAYDSGNYWCSTYYDPDGWIYKITESGTILTQFAAPDNQPWDLCMEHGNLWMADYWGDALYAIDPNTGNVLETHASEHSDPAGVVYDGQYLWYCDNGSGTGQDWLYKVELGGAGTPVINIPNTNYPFGTVTVGDSASWNCYVYSIGTGDLEITDITIAGLNASDVHYTLDLPQTLIPGSNLVIPFTYVPAEAGSLNCIATVFSNDPLSSEVDITMTGDAVNDGPSIHVMNTAHNYGTVRANSLSRWYIEVENIGDALLSISDVYTSNPTHFFIDESVTYPINLYPLETTEIGVWFTPAAGIYYSETVSIISNDPAQPTSQVSVTGEGNNIDYPIGDQLWYYYVTGSYDNSIKAIAALPDINGDGVDDVVVCSEDYYIRCLNGNSSGLADVLWALEIYSGSLSYQKELNITKDLDGDGYLDIVVGTPWGDRSIHAISGKTGTIIWTHDTHEYGGGGWVYQVDSDFDFNGDGTPDVLAATGDDADDIGPQRVYCLNGTNGVSIWEFYTPGPKFSVIGVDDVNGDNIPDAIGGASDQSELYGYVYGINGANGTQLWSYGVSGSSVWALGQLDDINDDGVKDIIVGDFYGAYYYMDPTNGSVIHTGSMGSCLLLDIEIMDDVNGDNYKDAMIENSTTNARMLNGYSASSIWNVSLYDKAWNIARIDDISGDGINDVIIGTLYSNNYCYFLNGVDGNTLDSFNFGQAIDAINAIPDIVGDGSMEMVVGGRNGTVSCYSGGLNSVVSVDDEPNISNTIITQNFPNPFSNTTMIKFSKPVGCNENTTIKVYNLIGQLVTETQLEPMQNSYTWDGTDLLGNEVSSGVYFYKVQNGTYNVTSKMIYMK